jgi:alpha-glucosidase
MLHYMKQSFSFCLAIVLLLLLQKASAADTTMVKSPDGLLAFKLFPQNNGLHFTLTAKGQTIIAASPMEMSVDGISITKNVAVIKTERYSRKETYAVLGAHATANDDCNGAVVSMTAGGGAIKTTLDIRVFNDGAAFRHTVAAERPTMTPAEATVFTIPAKSDVWYHDMNMHYESVHQKKKMEEVQKGEWLAPPATFKTPGGFYAAITEAALMNYAGMSLEANGKNGAVVRLANDQPTSYPYKLRYSAEDTLRLKQPAAINGKIITPWRVVIVGKDLNALVNNDIVTNLNAAPDQKLFPKGLNTGWVRPGRAVWKYLNGGGDGTLEVMKHFTDGAAALGFEHNILEGFWSRWPVEQLKELVDYSTKKGVGIWLWKHSKSLRNPASRDSFFKLASSVGVAGAKIDFLDHEAKEVIDLYEDILTEAAQHKMLIDFHGANKPTGLIRTFPNELTVEAVKGMEASKLTDRATHETTIPFTRCIVGPAEYTVVHFGQRRANTTWAHQVASAAILSSPLLTYAAHPDTILMNPAVNIIKAIPPTWDETIVLPPSEIGQVAAFARRKGNTWFLAVMNGVEPRKIKIPLSFLKGSSKATIAKDNALETAALVMEERNYSPGDVIELDLVTGGGFIAMFRK